MLFRRIFSAIYGKFTMWLISKGIIVIEDKKATTKKDAVGTFSEVASLLSGLPSPKITDSEIDDAENQDSDAVAELAARTRLAEPGRADEDPEDFLVVDANGARFPASALLADIRDGVIDDIAGFRQEGPPKAVTFVSQRGTLTPMAIFGDAAVLAVASFTASGDAQGQIVPTLPLLRMALERAETHGGFFVGFKQDDQVVQLGLA